MDELNYSEKKLKIGLLGDFSITDDKVELTYENLSSQLCNLLAFLIVNRDKPVSQAAIIDALWPEGINNLSAALKNLVYRFRKTGEKLQFSSAKNLIISAGGSYRLNGELPLKIDTESFSQFFVYAESQSDELARSQALREAVDCFEGDFLDNLDEKGWIIPIKQHYHNLYFRAVYALLEIYRQTNNFDDMYKIAKRATEIDEFEEEAHKYVIYALAKQGNQQQAITLYGHVSELFYRELGVELSPSFRLLYNEISKSGKSENTDIIQLKNELNENPSEITSAFYCELEVFKQLYRFEARSAVRNGSSIFIGMFTINSSDEQTLEKPLRERALSHLHQTIRESLRKGDVFSRCSSNQYVLMLPMINFENGMMVLERIEKRFKSTFHSKKIILSHNLQQLDPAGWM